MSILQKKRCEVYKRTNYKFGSYTPLMYTTIAYALTTAGGGDAGNQTEQLSPVNRTESLRSVV